MAETPITEVRLMMLRFEWRVLVLRPRRPTCTGRRVRNSGFGRRVGIHHQPRGDTAGVQVQVRAVSSYALRITRTTTRPCVMCCVRETVWCCAFQNVRWLRRHQGATAACKQLIQESAKRWREEEGDYRDDITAVVLFLPLMDLLGKTAEIIQRCT